MNPQNTTATAPKATLHSATSLLFHIAARSHTLAERFGVETIDPSRDGEEPSLKFYSIERPWLQPHIRSSGELAFNPDKFARKLTACTAGERDMILFILNVWNPSYAASKGWKFDLFSALGRLDENNRQAIAWWLERPLWP